MAKVKGKLSHIRIEPASNGYTVHSHHEQSQSEDGKSAPYQEEKPSVFGNKEDVMKHVGDQLAAHEKASGGGTSDTSSHPLRKGLFPKKAGSSSAPDCAY